MKIRAGVLLVPLLCSCLSVGASPWQAVPKYTVLGMQGQGVFFTVIDKTISGDKKALKSVADAVCKNHASFCVVHFWSDRTKAASKIPMTDAQVDAEVAQYNRNKNTGLDRLLVCVKGNCNP